MDIRTLKNSELHAKLNILVGNERKLIHEVLLHIIEVERRKLFLDMAYSSLYEYLVTGIGYSEASAQRRIDAARLIVQMPELGSKIEKGDIKLSQISQVQKSFRNIKKIHSRPVALAKKKEIVQQIENKSRRET